MKIVLEVQGFEVGPSLRLWVLVSLATTRNFSLTSHKVLDLYVSTRLPFIAFAHFSFKLAGTNC